ncbi:glucose-1-phosphate cytidylyltransferase [Endothiovibrio diazotrophicus]
MAGGLGTRLSEETELKPKPMVEIGGRPILWHIMKLYSRYGFNEFVILLGYKGYLVKEYFANYFLHQSDVTIDLAGNGMEIHNSSCEPWKVTLLDTGLETMTGGRILRAREFVGDQPFLLTYGDGVADIDILRLVDFHRGHSGMVTMTSVQPAGRFGALDVESDLRVSRFLEKPKGDGAWVNGGFFVCDPQVFDYIAGDAMVFEEEPLQRLAREGHLYTFHHDGFWKCMDTLRDKRVLEEMWARGEAAWRVW